MLAVSAGLAILRRRCDPRSCRRDCHGAVSGADRPPAPALLGLLRAAALPTVAALPAGIFRLAGIFRAALRRERGQAIQRVWALSHVAVPSGTIRRGARNLLATPTSDLCRCRSRGGPRQRSVSSFREWPPSRAPLFASPHFSRVPVRISPRSSLRKPTTPRQCVAHVGERQRRPNR